MEYFIRDNETKTWIPIYPPCTSILACNEVIESLAGGNYSVHEGQITVCAECGSPLIEQQLSMMVPADCNKSDIVERVNAGSFYMDDYFFCFDCDDETMEEVLFAYVQNLYRKDKNGIDGKR